MILSEQHGSSGSARTRRVVVVALLIAVLLLITSHPGANPWIQSSRCSSFHRHDSTGNPASIPCSAEADVSAGDALASEEKFTRLLYGTASTGQDSYSCPFDFARPVPADEKGQPLTYEECLAQHGRSLDSGYRFRWLQAAAAGGRQRHVHITRHVADMWLWSLAQGVGTPCRPMILTYVCREKVCGGLGDRVRGQNMAFWQAVLTHSFFISQWERPVPIEEYLIPASHSLGFPDVRACLHGLRNTSARVMAWSHLQDYSASRMAAFDPAKLWRGADVVESRSNHMLFAEMLQAPALARAVARYRLTGLPIRDLLYTGLALYLHRPSQYMQEAVQPYMQQLSQPPGVHRIGVHVRIGGDKLADPQRHPVGAAGCFAKEALAQCADVAPRPCVAFLAADAAEALQHVRETLEAAGIQVVVAAGVITHNDKPGLAPQVQGNHSTLVAQSAKTYVDWYLLSQMDSLVMSRSGFSFAAAWAARPTMARWLDDAASQAGQCRFLDYNARCRGDHCVGIGLAFYKRPSDELGDHGPFASADQAEGS